MKNKTTQDVMTRIIKDTQAKVAEYGHAVFGIFADTETVPPTPPFAYTVGLETTYGHPELIVFGLPAEHAQQMLNGLAMRIKSEGLVLKDGHRDEQVAEGFSTYFRTVPSAAVEEHMRMSCALQDNVRAFQMVWPDPANKFPWEDGADPKFAAYQPLLYEQDAPH